MTAGQEAKFKLFKLREPDVEPNTELDTLVNLKSNQVHANFNRTRRCKIPNLSGEHSKVEITGLEPELTTLLNKLLQKAIT